MNIEIIEVDAKTAQEWLDTTKINRRVRNTFVESLASDMYSGDWSDTGETIKFDVDGHLIDGQHRLNALVLANEVNKIEKKKAIKIKFAVARGLDPLAQQDIDRGARRTFADVLALKGEINVPTLASIILRVHEWERGNKRRNSRDRPTTAQLLRTFEKHPELRSYATEANTLSNRIRLPQSTIGLCLYLFNELDPDDTQEFFARLADGQGLVAGDPMYTLRRTLEALVNQTRGRPDQVMALALTIKAWNAYRSGTQIQVLRWRAGGAKPEAFPEPI